jgi:hypothetical protein
LLMKLDRFEKQKIHFVTWFILYTLRGYHKQNGCMFLYHEAMGVIAEQYWKRKHCTSHNLQDFENKLNTDKESILLATISKTSKSLGDCG